LLRDVVSLFVLILRRREAPSKDEDVARHSVRPSRPGFAVHLRMRTETGMRSPS
jgi:hypothetical protein